MSMYLEDKETGRMIPLEEYNRKYNNVETFSVENTENVDPNEPSLEEIYSTIAKIKAKLDELGVDYSDLKKPKKADLFELLVNTLLSEEGDEEEEVENVDPNEPGVDPEAGEGEEGNSDPKTEE